MPSLSPIGDNSNLSYVLFWPKIQGQEVYPAYFSHLVIMVHANDMVNVTPFLLSIFWVQGGEGILGNKDKKSRELSEKHVARPKCTNTKHVSFECVKFKPKLMFCFVLQAIFGMQSLCYKWTLLVLWGNHIVLHIF